MLNPLYRWGGWPLTFHKLEEKLNELSDISLVHLRAAWFMENTAIWAQSVAKYNRIAWSMRPDLKMPWVATDDIARLAAEELTHPIGAHRVIREVGSEEFTMNELAALIATEIGHAVEYRQIEKNKHDRAEFIERFGTEDRWRDDQQTAEEYNNGAMRFHGSGAPLRPELPTKMADFLKVFWMPRYLRSAADDSEPQTYFTWTARN